jgi:hypothetical protein
MVKKMSRTIAAAVVAFAVAGGLYAFLGSAMVPTANARLKDHPRLESAHSALKDAKEYLEASERNFHGHKDAAVRAMDFAMKQIYLCSEEADRRDAPEPRSFSERSEHAKLYHAKEQLKDAREYLRESRHDFHGHKTAAIEGLDVAIHQIDICLED